MTADDRLVDLVRRTLEHLGGFIDPLASRPVDFAVEAGQFVSPTHNWAVVLFAGQRHPLIDGILYCRREPKHEQCLELLCAGDRTAALIPLLNDRDEYDRQPPADEADLRELVEAVDLGCPPPMYAAMRSLKYGPVADYFAIRPATPTFLSGLGLLCLTTDHGDCVTEVGCGVGQFLWWLRHRGYDRCGGVDVVFSKLWLARQYLVGDVPLATVDVVDLAVRHAGGSSEPSSQETSDSGRHLVFCHDVLYFLKRKTEVLRYFRDAAGDGGSIAVGHTHQRDVDLNASGEPLTAAEYVEVFRTSLGSEPAAFDDAKFLGLTLGRLERFETRPPAELSAAPALAFVWPHDNMIAGSGLNRVDDSWRVALNPQLRRDAGSGQWSYHWPDPRFEAEYCDADYLSIDEDTSRLIDRVASRLPCAAGELRQHDARVDELLTRRLLLPSDLACEATT